ncbi:hypothetical protein GH714_023652 [Hevea brasiliensis]|uniref:GrpE protein homolog n=1 Tax=Hevea brasiliensis TaxID=3981 RepID=A0A6A6LUW4_HEVBR|nr:hypothetical protein GH714_023652 [Hevea brasiliensis]
MLMSRVVLSRVSRGVGRRSLLLFSPSQKQHPPIFSNRIDSLVHEYPNQFVASQVSLFHQSAFSSSPFQRFGFSSSASVELNEKEQGSSFDNNGASSNVEPEKPNGDAKPSDQVEDPSPGETKQSDSEAEGDLSMDDLVKLVAEKEELLKLKRKEIEKMQDKVLRTYAEMENVMERTKREAENSKKFAIQVFRKFGVENFDPINEPFDPHRHNAVFQVPDASKPPGTVAAVLKAGYTLYDRIIRPAEVGVTKAEENDTE